MSFELGGNAPFVVFDDANLKEAVEGAAAIKFMRVAGQSCICANRIYVQEGIAPRFLPAFVERVNAIKVGEGFQPGVEVGPLINEETLDKVDSLVRDAVAKEPGSLLVALASPPARWRKVVFLCPDRVCSTSKRYMPVCRRDLGRPLPPSSPSAPKRK